MTGKEMRTGFGLLICKEVIDLNYGQINYTTSSNRTMFSLKIPKSVKKED